MTVDVLKPLKGKRRVRRYIAADIESKRNAGQLAGFERPFQCGWYDGKEYHFYTNDERTKGIPWREAWWHEGGCVARWIEDLLTPRHDGYYLYAHNGGSFDWLFVMTWLERRGRSLGYLWELVPIASGIQQLKITRVIKAKNGNERKLCWKLVDSYRLITMGLDRAAKTFGLEGKVKHDLNLHEKDPRWCKYLKGDCVELYKVLEAVHHYVEDVLCGEVGLTMASTAMKTFRRGYLKDTIERNSHTHDFIRHSIHGGRTEVFRLYGERLSVYDINSSYPASMMEPMPVGPATMLEGEPPRKYLTRSDYVGFCSVDVEVPKMAMGPLPIKGNGQHGPKGKLIFPVGRLSGIWEWSELQLALELGCIIKRWHQSIWYAAWPIFEEYVTHLYGFRKESHPQYSPGLALVAKGLLNSTFGKFAQRLERHKYYPLGSPDMPRNNVQPVVGGDLECPVWRSTEKVDQAYIIPQISARVTALSRVRLYRGFLGVMTKGGQVYYCDTDSNVADVPMTVGTELGEWKDEYPQYSGQLYGAFVAPKVYRLWAMDGEEQVFEKIKMKGLNSMGNLASGWAEEGAERFGSYSMGRSVMLRRITKVGAMAREGFKRGPRMVTMAKQLRASDGKRRALPNGETEPFELEMW